MAGGTSEPTVSAGSSASSSRPTRRAARSRRDALDRRARRLRRARHARSGVELEAAFARGVVSAGGDCVLGGVLPTPAVALLALDLGVVISASHNPPEYNGVKFFDARRAQALRRGRRSRSRRCSTAAPGVDTGASSTWSCDRLVPRRHPRALRLRSLGAPDRGRLRERRLRRPRTWAFEQCGAEVHAIGDAPDGDEHQRGLRCDRPLAAPADGSRGGSISGSRSTATATGCSRSTSAGGVDGDQIVAVLALDLGVDLVAVTPMTNLGFHALMDERGIRVHTTDVGDRYVLEALQREGAYSAASSPATSSSCATT